MSKQKSSSRSLEKTRAVGQYVNSVPRIILAMVVPKDWNQDRIDKEFLEVENLVTTFGGFVVVKKIQHRGNPSYATYLGKGKVDELLEICDPLGIDIVIINNALKPAQMYNIIEKFEKEELITQVWDRVDLILKIFEKHATTQEAKLQIELAAIKHMGPRIFGMGMELSRQGGGVGTRGLGETNTSIMKTHLQKHKNKIEAKVEKFKKVRETHRRSRERRGFKQAAIVGYTNAGKSTLLNALTRKGAYAADELFATLDTRTAKVYIPESEKEILITDTIGFIKNLPPNLINAFKSTLEETIHADLLIHVIDLSNPEFQNHILVVEGILKKLNIDDSTKQIYVFNKIDMYESEISKEGGPLDALREQYSDKSPIFISSKENDGLTDLKSLISEMI